MSRGKYAAIVMSSLIAVLIAALAISQTGNRDLPQSITTSAPTMRYVWGTMIYSYQGTDYQHYTANPDWVTRWVTPAPSGTDAAIWQPTAQAPELSTLAPWQTPDPTLICLTNCEP